MMDGGVLEGWGRQCILVGERTYWRRTRCTERVKEENKTSSVLI